MTPPSPLGRREGARDGVQSIMANDLINHVYEASIKLQRDRVQRAFRLVTCGGAGWMGPLGRAGKFCDLSSDLA